jgi:hypothetical protein
MPFMLRRVIMEPMKAGSRFWVAAGALFVVGLGFCVAAVVKRRWYGEARAARLKERDLRAVLEQLQRVYEGAGFAEFDLRGASSDSDDEVQEASEMSFPASDAPAWFGRLQAQPCD